MTAILLECPICKRVYSVERMDEKDSHQCICGQILDKQTNYVGFCENENMPNKPRGAWKTATALRPGFPLHHGDDGIEVVYPKKLSKKVTIDVEAGKGFNELLKNVEELEERLSNIPGLVMIDSDGKTNVIPVISIDSKMIVFRTIYPMRKEDRETIAKEYTHKLGVKCEVIDLKTEMAAIIDG